jgi:hypothetical protein
VFEYIEKNLLEVLEENASGIDVCLIVFYIIFMQPKRLRKFVY